MPYITSGSRASTCNANITRTAKPIFHARRWVSVTAKNALRIARHVQTPAPTASSDHSVLSGRCAVRVKRDTGLKEKQKVWLMRLVKTVPCGHPDHFYAVAPNTPENG